MYKVKKKKVRKIGKNKKVEKQKTKYGKKVRSLERKKEMGKRCIKWKKQNTSKKTEKERISKKVDVKYKDRNY